MKKVLAFLLIFQFLGLSAFANELSKLPALLEHYFDYSNHHHHHPADHHRHLMDFVSDHYGSSDHRDSKDHSDLPFKKDSQQSIINSTLYLDFCETQVLFLLTEEEFVNEQAIGRIPVFISNYRQTIWQPPKIVTCVQ